MWPPRSRKECFYEYLQVIALNAVFFHFFTETPFQWLPLLHMPLVMIMSVINLWYFPLLIKEPRWMNTAIFSSLQSLYSLAVHQKWIEYRSLVAHAFVPSFAGLFFLLEYWVDNNVSAPQIFRLRTEMAKLNGVPGF